MITKFVMVVLLGAFSTGKAIDTDLKFDDKISCDRAAERFVEGARKALSTPNPGVVAFCFQADNLVVEAKKGE